jgi:hypothetical protein
MCLMDCIVVVRILVSASWLGLGMGNGMTRHNYTQSIPTQRPLLTRRSR